MTQPTAERAPAATATGRTLHDPRRRALLRAMGVGGGVAAAPAAVQAAVARPRARGDALRVALLLPSADAAITHEAHAFRAGFRLAARAGDARPLAITEHDIGGGVGRALAFVRGQRAARDADVVVAMVNPRAVPWLRPEVEASALPVVVANAGERMVRDDAIARSLVHASLELTTSAYAAGQWAATHAGRTCALACSWYESGYDMAPAFRAGFEAAGGRVMLSRITETPHDARDAADAGRLLAASDADVVAAFYPGEESRAFFAAYGAATVRSRRVVMTSPLVSSDQAAGVAVTSVTAWTPDLPHAANAAFVAAFTAAHGHRPDAFAMLGYETARRLGAAANGGAGALRDALRQPRADDVRGAVALDPRTHEIRSRLVLRTLTPAGGETLADLAFDPGSAPLGRALPRHHGWIMPYQFA